MSHLRSVLAAALTLAAALPASACLNDREILIAENEFKSSYMAKKAEEPGPLARVPIGGWVTAGVGSVLLGATVVASRRPRHRPE